MVVWELGLDEQAAILDSVMAPVRTVADEHGIERLALFSQRDAKRERVSVLCRHGERAQWEHGGYSRTAEDYHVWRCTVGTCKSTMIRECTSRVRVDRECRCVTQEVGE